MYCSSFISVATSESSLIFQWEAELLKWFSPLTTIFKIHPFPNGSRLISCGFPESGQIAFFELHKNNLPSCLCSVHRRVRDRSGQVFWTGLRTWARQPDLSTCIKPVRLSACLFFGRKNNLPAEFLTCLSTCPKIWKNLSTCLTTFVKVDRLRSPAQDRFFLSRILDRKIEQGFKARNRISFHVYLSQTCLLEKSRQGFEFKDRVPVCLFILDRLINRILKESVCPIETSLKFGPVFEIRTEKKNCLFCRQVDRLPKIWTELEHER